ncbi:MAG TPA: M20/M25/M40 family metallo-hydrolase [Bryobacteraceae bacterium]|nr:M20/M25/M40 family metallo-hydrolase [Bryobacteraceae bacterium]
MFLRLTCLSLLAILLSLAPFCAAEEKVDLLTIHRIKAEALENSKVMDVAFYLSDVHGPRMTNTPQLRQAAEWATKWLQEQGVSNVKLEKWGPYGRGWMFTRYRGEMLEPRYSPLIGFPLAWSASTKGPISGEPMMAVIRSEADMEKHKGKLRGRIVMTSPIRQVAPQSTAPAQRYTDAQLLQLGNPPEGPSGTPDPAMLARIAPFTAMADYTKFRNKLRQFLVDEGVALAIESGRGEAGTVFGQSASTREKKDSIAVPTAVLAVEHYNRIARLVEKKIPVKVEFDLQSQVFEDSLDGINIVGEIPGGKKKDEVVIIGAHFDSWHGGTGATDNAAGCSVMMEAMRILKTLDLKMDRTVRIALWTGEENGLLGSKAYVKEHFADPETMNVTAEHGKVAAYFNVDNGTGKIRGVYLQGNDMVRPIFDAWLAPFKDYGATTTTIRNTGGTDHLSFNAIGIPGFQFVQDGIEYSSRTHHSNMDTYDHLVKADLAQAAAVVASFAYHAANREEMLPRVPLPKPKPVKKEDEDKEGENKRPSGTQ